MCKSSKPQDSWLEWGTSKVFKAQFRVRELEVITLSTNLGETIRDLRDEIRSWFCRFGDRVHGWERGEIMSGFLFMFTQLQSNFWVRRVWELGWDNDMTFNFHM
ncbi:Hypothetical predicted protein [Olea europaea subsp. europaea]|uniref:Uncharacterized protein n=1 Tax=Olea europaea subsp. europaea TaxID=158383 RepID=A0A8S0QV73_OLEEU|nr:Hypothetical predicted protein [Olea europaea subsp. europaea]